MSEDEFERELERFYQEEEDIRRYEQEERERRDLEKYGDPYTDDELEMPPPLTEEEWRLYRQYQAEEREREKKKKLERQRILEARDMSLQQELERKKKELADWKKTHRGIRQLGRTFEQEYEQMISDKAEMASRKRAQELEKEMQRVYEEEYLPLLRQDREKEQEKIKAERKRRKQQLVQKKREERKKALEKEKEEKRIAQHRAQQKAAKKERAEKRVIQIVPREVIVQQEFIPSDDEEVEIDEEEGDIDPELQKKLLEVAEREVIPLTVASPVQQVRKSKKKKKSKKMTLAEFEKSMDKHPECNSLFKFSWGSKQVPPGEGKGEKRETGKPYARLARVKDWRKKLSNMWKAPFVLDGKKWQTVEHYVQSRKFDKYPDFAHTFSMDSGSKMSTYPLMAKYAGEKSGKFQKKQVRPRKVKIDKNFYKGDNYYTVMALATYAKFSQNEHLKILLDDTDDACLYHVQKGKKDEHYVWLEKVRTCLRLAEEQGWDLPELNSKMFKK